MNERDDPRLPVARILLVLNRWDPYGLLEIGAPEDEFLSECLMIRERLRAGMTTEEIARIVDEVFSRQFFPEDFGIEKCLLPARWLREEIDRLPKRQGE